MTEKSSTSQKYTEKKHVIDAQKTDSQSNSSSAKDFRDDMQGLLGTIDKLFTEWFVVKAPALPVNVKEGLVKYLPIINLIILILGGVGLVGALDSLLIALPLIASVSILAPVASGQSIVYLIISLGLGILGFYFRVQAQQGLNKQKKSAWTNLWYAQLVGIVGTILTIFTGFGFFSIVFGLAFDALFMYFLYQLRKYYKN
jgi:hypothetical protein